MSALNLKPHFTPSASTTTADSPSIRTIISSLSLLPHIEGGFYVSGTPISHAQDKKLQIQNVLLRNSCRNRPRPRHSHLTLPHCPSTTSILITQRPGFDPALRNSSTTIFYLLTPSGPQGGFHRNKARTVHTLHRGRGRYVLIHADESEAVTTKKRIETFIVGHDVAKGERLQWIVEGGKYKASFLLPDVEGGETSDGLLISETVVPGFGFCDHDFLSKEGLVELLSEEDAEALKWLLSPLGKK